MGNPYKNKRWFLGTPFGGSEVVVTPTAEWILENGYWDDDGVWDDDATWNDGTTESIDSMGGEPLIAMDGSEIKPMAT